MEGDSTKKLKAFEFLCDNRLAVVSTTSYKDQSPEGAVVYYVVDEKFIYFITARESRKLANINQNNNLAFTIFSEVPPLELQIQGTAESVDDPEQKGRISKIYLENANKNPDTINWPPILKLPNDEGFIFVKVTINWFKFSDFRQQEGQIVEGSPSDWQ